MDQDIIIRDDGEENNIVVNESFSVCTFCSKQIEATKMKKHSVYHKQEEVKIKCDFCDKLFSNKAKLTIHKASHSAARFNCQECNQIFRDLSNFKRHQRLHESKEYLCTECGQQFARDDYLKAHVKTHQT